MLISLIGNNATSSHGGLIEMAFTLKLKDIANSIYYYAKYFLECAKNSNISTVHLKSDLVDVIKYYNIKENKAYINMLLDEDNIDKFNFYLEGALEDNIFSMNMLANHYIHGIGCNKNIDEGIKWYKNAASKGSDQAKTNIKKLTERNIFDNMLRKIFS